MRIIIENADQNDFNELAKLARAGKINTFCMTDDERPQGDLISRSALKETLQYKSECIDCSDECCTSCFYDIIDNAPPIKFSLLPADESKEEAYMRGYNHGFTEGILKANTRPKGEWIEFGVNNQGTYYKCSKCGFVVRDFPETINTTYPFCTCGADMRKGGAE